MAAYDTFGGRDDNPWDTYDSTPSAPSGGFGITDPPARSNTSGENHGPDEAAWNQTHFYTDSPGPLYDNYGRRNSTPQPTAEGVYDIVKSGGYYGTEGADPSGNALNNLQNAYSAYGYNASPYMYGNTPSGNELSINGQKQKFISGGDVGQPGTSWYQWGANDQVIDPRTGGWKAANSPTSYLPPSNAGYNNQGIFDDPATSGWMKLLMDRVNGLNQPYQPPSLGPLTDYLKSYFEKLQGPAYTPQQMDLLQTQSLDPLSRERDAVRQRITENASRRGLDLKSGIVQKQLSDAENQFEQIRTKTQAGFASKAVDLDRINAQQAASVGQLLANIEQSNFNSNEQRAGQALDISKMVPDLARQRMMDANQILSGSQINPTSLLQLQQQGDQFGSQQTQNYMLGIGQLLPYLLKAFGIGQ